MKNISSDITLIAKMQNAPPDDTLSYFTLVLIITQKTTQHKNRSVFVVNIIHKEYNSTIKKIVNPPNTFTP